METEQEATPSAATTDTELRLIRNILDVAFEVDPRQVKDAYRGSNFESDRAAYQLWERRQRELGNLSDQGIESGSVSTPLSVDRCEASTCYSLDSEGSTLVGRRACDSPLQEEVETGTMENSAGGEGRGGHISGSTSRSREDTGSGRGGRGGQASQDVRWAPSYGTDPTWSGQGHSLGHRPSDAPHWRRPRSTSPHYECEREGRRSQSASPA